MQVKLCPRGGVREWQLFPSVQAAPSLPTLVGMELWVFGVCGSVLSRVYTGRFSPG